jgi:hypothetical protein
MYLLFPLSVLTLKPCNKFTPVRITAPPTQKNESPTPKKIVSPTPKNKKISVGNPMQTVEYPTSPEPEIWAKDMHVCPMILNSRH